MQIGSSDSDPIYKFDCIKDILEKAPGQEKFKLENLNPNNKNTSYYDVRYGKFQDIITVFYNKGNKFISQGFVFYESLQKLYNLDEIKTLKDKIMSECRV